MASEEKEDYRPPFVFHGVKFTGENTTQWIGTCPFPDCLKKDKFFVGKATGQWDCKHGGREGNISTFLSQLHEYYLVWTKKRGYTKLANGRWKGLDPETLEAARIAYTGAHWLVPVYGRNGKLVQLRILRDKGPLLNTAGVEAALYGAECLAEEPDEPVFLVEGESSCLATRQLIEEGEELGIVVAVPGAGQLKDHEVKWFADRDVILLPDFDTPGQRGMNKIIKKFQSTDQPPASLQILQWPEDTAPKTDMRDFVKAGGEIELILSILVPVDLLEKQLYEKPLVQVADPDVEAIRRKRYWSGTELAETNIPEPAWLIRDMLPEGLAMLGGMPKAGKSYILLQLAKALACDEPFLGYQTEFCKTLIISYEDGPGRLRKRMYQEQHWSEEARLHVMCDVDCPTWDNGGLKEVLKAITNSPYRLIGLDTFSMFLGASSLDQCEAGDMTKTLAPMKNALVGTGKTLLIVDHVIKSSTGDIISDLRGSTAKVATADTLWGLYRPHGQTAELRTAGRDVRGMVIPIRWNGLTFHWEAARNEDGTLSGGLQEDIIDVLVEMGGKGTATEVAGILGKNRPNIRAELLDLEGRGVVVRGKRGALGTPFTLLRSKAKEWAEDVDKLG